MIRRSILGAMALVVSAFARGQAYTPVPYGFEFARLTPGTSTVVLANALALSFFDTIRNESAHFYQEKPRTVENPRAQAALLAAENQYFQRGGAYRYGPNDCSTFVCDFLQNYTKCVSHRFTTDRLYDSSFMNQRGFVQLTSPFRDLQPYDVLVYRYFDTDFMAEGGHCGVVVWKDGKLCVEHNSSSNKGLAVTSIDEFYQGLVGRQGLRTPKLFRWAGQ